MLTQITRSSANHTLTFPVADVYQSGAADYRGFTFMGYIMLASGAKLRFAIDVPGGSQSLWENAGVYCLTVCDETQQQQIAKYIGEGASLSARMNDYHIVAIHDSAKHTRLCDANSRVNTTGEEPRTVWTVGLIPFHDWRILEIATHLVARKPVGLWFAPVADCGDRLDLEDRLLGEHERQLRFFNCIAHGGWNASRRDGWGRTCQCPECSLCSDKATGPMRRSGPCFCEMQQESDHGAGLRRYQHAVQALPRL
jgi:hypothetical protein